MSVHRGAIENSYQPWYEHIRNQEHAKGLFLTVALLCELAACTDIVPTPCDYQAIDPALRMLVFTRTQGYRHEAITEGTAALCDLAATRDWAIALTEDPATFSAEGLADYDLTVWLLTYGDVLSETQEQAFEAFVAGGGGYVGIHSGTATEYDWPWYGEFVGAYFDEHPAIQTATMTVVDPTHPATEHLAGTWQWEDEWYNFHAQPRAGVDILLTVDESTYSGGTMGANHPIAWSHELDGGRMFQTSLGHRPASYSDPVFLEHLTGAIRWVGGLP